MSLLDDLDRLREVNQDALAKASKEIERLTKSLSERLQQVEELRVELKTCQLERDSLKRVWQPIETCPELAEGIFWIRPRTREEAWIFPGEHDPVTMTGPARLFYGRNGTWSSLMIGVCWMPPPSPPPQSGKP